MLASYCGVCGKQFQSTETFCAGCGTPRDDTNVSNTTLVSAPNAPTVLSRTALPGSISHTAQSENRQQSREGGCEIPLNNGSNCGVTTLGRCATCGRAFCLTHQARKAYSYGLVPLVDMCVSCYDKTPERVAEAERAKRSAEISAAEQYFRSGSARTALLNSGVPPVEIYQVRRDWELKRKGILLREVREQVVKVATPIGHGWILGTFKWEYHVSGPGPRAEMKTVTEDCLTALLEVSKDCPAHLVPRFSYHMPDRAGLARVQPYSGGYEYLGDQGDRFEGGYNYLGVWSEGGWIAAAKTVKRLIGASS